MRQIVHSHVEIVTFFNSVEANVTNSVQFLAKTVGKIRNGFSVLGDLDLMLSGLRSLDELQIPNKGVLPKELLTTLKLILNIRLFTTSQPGILEPMPIEPGFLENLGRLKDPC